MPSNLRDGSTIGEICWQHADPCVESTLADHSVTNLLAKVIVALEKYRPWIPLQRVGCCHVLHSFTQGRWIFSLQWWWDILTTSLKRLAAFWGPNKLKVVLKQPPLSWSWQIRHGILNRHQETLGKSTGPKVWWLVTFWPPFKWCQESLCFKFLWNPRELDWTRNTLTLRKNDL